MCHYQPGIEHKTKVAAQFLRHKLVEHDNFQAEIAELRRDAAE